MGELQRLMDAATADHEKDLIHEVAVRAGLRWACPRPSRHMPGDSCRWHNTERDRICGSCAYPRPACMDVDCHEEARRQDREAYWRTGDCLHGLEVTAHPPSPLTT